MQIDLFTNSFLRSQSFSHLFDRLVEEGEKQGVKLIRRTNTDVLATTADTLYDFSENAIFWDKDLYLAKYLEKKGVRLFNSAKAIETCDDKGLTHLALSGILPMPETYFSPKTFPSFDNLDYSFFDDVVEKLTLPVIVKQNFGSFGNEVYLCKTLDEVHEKIAQIGVKPFLIQKFVSSSLSKDVRVYVVGKKAIGAMKRTSKTDFRANVAQGGSAENFPLPDDYRFVAEKAAEVIGLDFCGVDILFGEHGEPLLCEVNSNAHFKGFEAATGINVAGKIIEHVKNTIESKG